MAEKPNILMIYADQMRYDCAGFSGNPDVKTPHLDRLFVEGVCFDEAFVSYPLCKPFRASLLTGKHAQRTGAYNNISHVDSSQPTLSRTMNSVGYKSGYVGKWHLHNGFMKPGFVPPGPDRMGFDHFVGFNRGHNYMDAIFYRDTDQPYKCRRFEPDFQTDHAIEFMEGAYASDVPFLAYVCFGPPHFPMSMPELWRRMYDPGAIALPKGEKLNFMKPNGSGDRDRKQREPENEIDTEWQIRKFVAGYYSLISSVDFNVGRLLNWLDAKALAENTIVLFFSDHGDMLGQHGSYCGSKHQAYRAAAQVPLLVRCAGRFSAGKRVNSLVDVAVDTMPTLLQVCGIDSPEGMQGISYLSLLEGGDTPTRDHVQYQKIVGYTRKNSDKIDWKSPEPQRGIRTRDWLYVRDENGPIYLFDQNLDRDELVNQANAPSHAGIQEELDARVRQNMDETGDAWELGAVYPKIRDMTLDEIKALQRAFLNDVVMPAAIEAP